MGRVLLVTAVLLAAYVAGCGGDAERAMSLTLEERILTEADAPGSEPDPVETRLMADGLDDFVGLRGKPVSAAEIDPAALEDAGFVAAINDTRFIPSEPGGAHTRTAPHLRLLVLQLESEDGANDALDLVHTKSQERCPGECAVEIEDFEVDRVPDAKGVRHFATAERVEEVGEGEPFDSYAILFADGVFVYELEGFGAPDAFAEEQVEEIAGRLYERVRGAPAPET